MTLTARSGAIGSTFTLALAGVALRAVRHIATALKNRADVRSLHELDDRALKDIGLVRSDVTAALGQSLLRDPSQHLCDVAGGKRGSRKPGITPVLTERQDRSRRPDADVKAAMA